MEEIKWRFPGNNFTKESGLDTPDMETFKKDPIASLAREVCQNSIDARLDTNKPVILEFNDFMLHKEKIPGRERLSKEIQNCAVEWQEHQKISKQLKTMELTVNQDIIDCLRISDFNTSGLTGIETDEKKAWYLLTKGSGISKKSGTTGGSKGIGKYASFVASKFNTIFYSTRTVEGELGFQGITKLCSASIEGTDEKTQGIGYYGINDKNKPIINNLVLDLSFERSENQTGTDIYILGFRKTDDWKKQVISKILDSFMVAIMNGDLEVIIGDTRLGKDTIHSIISSDEYILKSNYKSIHSQYLLLTDESVYQTNIDISSYGSATIRVIGFSKDEIHYATNACVMVRYPHMKIKSIKNISTIPSAAMCIIHDNKLNEILRDIENPQHTDWQINRIDESAEKKEVRAIIKEINRSIKDIVSEFLITSDESKTDIEGASDYLPDNSNTGADLGANQETIDKITITKVLRNKNRSQKGLIEDEQSEALEPDVGGVEGEGDESPKPSGENEGKGRGATPHDEDGALIDGDSDILKYDKLSGLKYTFFVINKKEGLYSLIFTAPTDEENCYLELKYVDESGSKSPVRIFDAHLNQSKCDIENEQKVFFPLFNGKKNQFTLKTDQTELFSSEVVIYASR